MSNDSPSFFIKDPNAKLDYGVDWISKGYLGTDIIVTGTWSVPTGITKVSESYTSGTCTIWLLGGTVGKSYDLINSITTAAGRLDDRTITILVRQK
jgi:hypothetical protein